ncbi:N-acetyl-beta-glucosaminyl-glycoprotein 4-beta-N-acetylgalactosaminyltransferase 1-like [Orbicella faveolata]|nr:N-acetyl-beta-glucosaminyl-glycoprotein 4-beta-N-acetylgalactosaminyltransferase 1-like [Orbicella faveolata]
MGTIQRCLRSRKLQRLGKCCLLLTLLTCFVWHCVYNFSKNPPNRKIDIGNYSLTLAGSTINNNSRVKLSLSALNIHIWRELCGSDIPNLRQHLFFPRYPNEKFKYRITEFQIEDDSLDYGQVIFGFVHPPNTMSYRFAIVSDDTSELWLSSSEDPNRKQLIARVFTEGETAWAQRNQLDKYPDQISEDMYLLKGSKYYLEVLHKQGIGDGFVQVFWKSFQEKEFKLISSEYLSLYSDDISVAERKDVYHSVLSERYHDELKQKSERISKEYLDFFSLPLIPKDSYLTSCEYKSSLGYHFSESMVYPGDDTVMCDYEDGSPNRVAGGDSVRAVVDKVTTSLRLKTSK